MFRNICVPIFYRSSYCELVPSVIPPKDGVNQPLNAVYFTVH